MEVRAMHLLDVRLGNGALVDDLGDVDLLLDGLDVVLDVGDVTFVCALVGTRC
jgi:hypothetical protein